LLQVAEALFHLLRGGEFSRHPAVEFLGISWKPEGCRFRPDSSRRKICPLGFEMLKLFLEFTQFLRTVQEHTFCFPVLPLQLLRRRKIFRRCVGMGMMRRSTERTGFPLPKVFHKVYEMLGKMGFLKLLFQPFKTFLEFLHLP
jgi:hypothetical protein